jgi:hypothetical protein
MRQRQIVISPEVVAMRTAGDCRRPLGLPGWERSVWGWDDRDVSLFAQLWRDGDGDEDGDPDIWIIPGPRWTETGLPEVLAARIAGATGEAEALVLLAMAASVPDGARLRDLSGL